MIVLVLGLSSFANPAQATIQNDCTSLFNVGDWSQLSTQVTSCLDSNVKFISGISKLCQADKFHFSGKYIRYSDYEKKYQEAAAAIEAMPDPTAEAQIRLVQAEQDWELLGHRVNVETLLGEVQQSYGLCSGN